MDLRLQADTYRQRWASYKTWMERADTGDGVRALLARVVPALDMQADRLDRMANVAASAARKARA